MLFKKREEMLSRIDALEKKVDELQARVFKPADDVLSQGRAIETLYNDFIMRTAKPKQVTTKVEQPKPKRKYRPRKKNGKETPAAE